VTETEPQYGHFKFAISGVLKVGCSAALVLTDNNGGFIMGSKGDYRMTLRAVVAGLREAGMTADDILNLASEEIAQTAFTGDRESPLDLMDYDTAIVRSASGFEFGKNPGRK
jgi:hypothetical protein